jgi:predicted CopG family antitoxin
MYREPELEVGGRIGVTPEAYEILKRAKKQKEQSMIRLVSELIIKHEDEMVFAKKQ